MGAGQRFQRVLETVEDRTQQAWTERGRQQLAGELDRISDLDTAGVLEHLQVCHAAPNPQDLGLETLVAEQNVPDLVLLDGDRADVDRDQAFLHADDRSPIRPRASRVAFGTHASPPPPTLESGPLRRRPDSSANDGRCPI